jgi:hypothetical protein
MCITALDLILEGEAKQRTMVPQQIFKVDEILTTC